jgi:putative tryptophan/tyrosine transport system substrate-binding protein
MTGAAMRRREFITLLGGAAVVSPFDARAQEPAKSYRIAIVHPSRPIAMLSDTGILQAFFKELHNLGYIEGQNLVVVRYSGEGRTEHYAELARDVVRSKPQLIFVFSARMVQHFKAATTTIPVVAFTSDPIAFGLASSLARPGGNITGVVVDVGIQVWDKQLEFLREAIPKASRVAYLSPRAVWDNPTGAAIRKAAQQIGIELLGALLDAPIQEAEYRRVFAMIAPERVDALIVNDTPENYTFQPVINEMVEKARLPTVYPNRYFVKLGGLMSYGTDPAALQRCAANQIDQILKGMKPGEIPFYQATKFELVINLKTAKTLGITFSIMLLGRADEVIE